MNQILAQVKAWAVPLLRTFLATFVTTLLASLSGVTHLGLSTIEQLGIAAAVAGINAVVLVVQRATPGVPNPVPPALSSGR